MATTVPFISLLWEGKRVLWVFFLNSLSLNLFFSEGKISLSGSNSIAIFTKVILILGLGVSLSQGIRFCGVFLSCLNILIKLLTVHFPVSP